ncbi:MAG TPA: multiheme c-type cytochrome, partial [Pyrinomonadaceae bacterium]|nr:multiheme c-type cytochrome [Pyrinomonadaceae bacterium]
MKKKVAQKAVKQATAVEPKQEHKNSSILTSSKVPLAIGLLIVSVISVAIWYFVTHRATNETETVSKAPKITASYVDNQLCAECHQKEIQDWTGSDHQLAMGLPSDDLVRGDFNNSTFKNFGVTTRFFKRDGKFMVNTESADGGLADFEIKYTFGIRPLQQYLVEFPGGRLQTLGTAWDTNKKSWFHIYANERIKPDDPLHWTKVYQNWNLQCADCHSTNLRKNYDPQKETYKTTWDVINVSCQSCHGPGSAHVKWARRHERRTDNTAEAIGLVGSLKSSPHDQVNVCLPCHTRRARITADDWAGQPLLDTFLPALLTEQLYYADGQFLEEDYEYGSFLQTKMYNDGVRCVDCHNAHTLKLKAEGNALCLQCHSERANRNFPKLIPKVYDTPAHHFHKPDSPGAQCVNCHMPAKNYMVVDARRDHSFRIPRPDLTIKIGTPNACNGCHKDKTPQWAVDAVAKWYGPNRRQESHYGEVIAAGRARKPEAASQLIALVRDKNIPAIVRATAVDLMDGYGPEVTQALIEATRDPEPLIRVTAVDGLDRLGPDEKLSVVTPLLIDPIRAVRIQAARVMTGAPFDRLEPAHRQEFDSALAEYKLAQIFNADIPSGNLNLALIETNMKQFDNAIEHYKIA